MISTAVKVAPAPALGFDDFQRDRLEFLRRCAETGDALSFRFAAEDVLVVSRPELVNDVLITHRTDFSKAYLTSLMHPLLAGSMLLADSDSWLHERKLVLPAFHHERLVNYAAIMQEEARRACASWATGQQRDVHSDMMRMTLQIVTRTLFGIDFSSAVPVAENLVATVMEEFNRRIASPVRFRFPLPTWRTLRLLQSMRALDEIAYRAIAERRNRPQADLLSMLVAAQDEEGRPMTDREVRDACLAVFFAGHETTACLLSWTWYELARRPDIEARMLDELDRQGVHAGDSPATLVERLPYMQAVLKEVLRLYPPAYAFGRRALRATSVGEHSVPAGTTVLMSPWAIQRQATYFEDPERFAPERWENGLASHLPRFAYFPFSSGPRRCVGSSYATMEATIVISTILPRFRLASQTEVRPAPSLTLRPAGGMPMTVSARPKSGSGAASQN
ncbi:MAG TPA: cytochrome P450 [Candidatus Limnocylindrales bacterium]|nr:cytochrome P450 [Candidatus Limnocylindrales bacterium]